MSSYVSVRCLITYCPGDRIEAQRLALVLESASDRELCSLAEGGLLRVAALVRASAGGHGYWRAHRGLRGLAWLPPHRRRRRDVESVAAAL